MTKWQRVQWAVADWIYWQIGHRTGGTGLGAWHGPKWRWLAWWRRQILKTRCPACRTRVDILRAPFKGESEYTGLCGTCWHKHIYEHWHLWRKKPLPTPASKP